MSTFNIIVPVGGTVYTEVSPTEAKYNHPDSATSWGYFSKFGPFEFNNGANITFSAKSPSPVSIYFKFVSDGGYPNEEPSYTTSNININSTEYSNYNIVLPSSANVYNFIELYLIGRDIDVYIKDITITPAPVPGLIYTVPLSEFNPSNENIIINNDNTYTFGIIDNTIIGDNMQVTIPFTYVTENVVNNNDGIKVLPGITYDIKQFDGVSLSYEAFNNFTGTISATDTPYIKDNMSFYRLFADSTTVNPNIGSWDTSGIQDMSFAFYNAHLFNHDIGNWNTSSVDNMHNMFGHAYAFNQNISTKISLDGTYLAWNTSNVIDMSHMFNMDPYDNFLGNFNNGQTPSNGTFVGNAPLLWNTSNVHNMEYMFRQCRRFNQNISTKNVIFDNGTVDEEYISFDTGNVMTMLRILACCETFNNGELPYNSTSPLYWNTNNVTSMDYMFGQYNFAVMSKGTYNQPMNTMEYTINGTTSVITYTSWNTSSVTNMYCMFQDNSFNQDIGSWDTNKVQDMAYMFNNCTPFNQNIGSWNTSSVTTMFAMFRNCTSFNQTIGSWNTSSVTTMAYMLANCTSFDQPINWNTLSVIDMYALFYNCRSFNQNIGNLNYTNVINTYNMLLNTGIKYDTYSTIIQDLYTNNTIHDVNFGTIGIHRINDNLTNTAYGYLTGTKNVIFNDAGSLTLSALEHMNNIYFPVITMNNDNNNDTTTLDRTEQYTIITDSGGRNNFYDNNQTLSHTVKFTDGVTLSVNTVLENTGDTLRIYNNDINGGLLYSSSGNINTYFPISAYNKLHFVFTSNDSIQNAGFILVLRVVPVLAGNICFRKGTLIDTDQGKIAINNIDTTFHTVRNKNIKFVTETISKHKELVCIKANSFAINIPSSDIVMSKEHAIFYKGKLLPIKNFVNIDGVDFIENNGEVLYNILLDSHEIMIVENMLVETLHPNNLLSQIYSKYGTCDNEIKTEHYNNINRELIENQVFSM